MKCNKSGANYHGQNSKMCPESYYSKSYFSRTNMCSVYTLHSGRKIRGKAVEINKDASFL